MPSPSKTEMATLRMWNVYGHLSRHIALYLSEARILYQQTYGAVQTAQQQMLNNQPLGGPGTTGGTTTIAPPTQDELTAALKIWLDGNPQWNSFISQKPNMTNKVHDLVTDIVCRYLAWDFYQAIAR